MEARGNARAMRCLHLFLLLIVPAFGRHHTNHTNHPNHTGGYPTEEVVTMVYNLSAVYTEAQRLEITWLNSSEQLGVRLVGYTMCLGPAGEQATCVNTSLSYWRGRTDRTCTNYTLSVAAVADNGSAVGREVISFISSPAALADLVVANRTASTLLVTWTGSARDTCVQDYLLSWRLSSEVVNEGSGEAPAGASSYHVADLRPCIRYDFVLATEYGGDQAVLQTFSAYTAAQGYPAMVSNLAVTGVASSEVTVKWSATSRCIENYRTCVRQFFHVNKTCSLQHSSQLQWTSPSNLLPCTNYSVGVTAVDYSGKMSGEAIKSVTTAPGEVRNLTVASRTPDSVYVTWGEPDGERNCLKGYEVYVCVHNASGTCDEPVVVLETSHNVTSLESCENYDVEVRSVGAENQRSVGARIASYTDVTDTSTVIASFSVDVQPERDSAGELEVSWSAAGDLHCIAGYRVCLQDGELAARSCDTVARSALRWTGPAHFCGNYTVQLAPVTVGGRPYQQLSATIATPPAAVRNLAVGNSSYGAVHVWWEPPQADCVRRYVVRWCLAGTPDCGGHNRTTAVAAQRAELPAGVHHYLVSDLQNCARYFVWVTAVAEGSAESEARSMHARAGYTSGKEPILNMQVSSVGTQVARVTWDTPRDAEYCVTEYRACLEEHYETGGAQLLSCSQLLSSREYWSNEYNLQPCTLYTLAVTPQDVGGGWMKNYTVSFVTGPQHVRSLSETELGPLVSEVRWVPPLSRTCLKTYRICWKLSEGENHTEICNTTSAEETALNLTGVVGCTSYNVVVTAIGAIGNISGTSDESNITYTTGFADPGPLTGVKYTVWPSNKLHVEWDAPTRNAACVSDYEVCLKLSGSTVQSCKLVVKTQLSWTSDSLATCASYDVSLANRHVTSEVDKTTSTQLTGPAALEDLSVSNGTETSITVSWRNPADNARCAGEVVVSWCYEEPHSQEQGSCQPSRNNSANIPATATQFSISDLLPCSNYTISVAAATSNNKLSTFATIQAHTLQQRPGGVLNASAQLEGSSGTVKWLAPSLAPTCVAGYQVCWWRRGARDPVPVCGRTYHLEFALGGGLSCEVYAASVRAVASDGSLSAASNVTLDLAVPGKVENLAVAHRTCESVAVEWDVPSANSDCVSNYDVCWRPDSAENDTCVQVPYEDIDTTIGQLQPRRQYRVILTAVGPSGEKSESSMVEVETGPAEVDDLSLSSRTETSISVSWRNPADNAKCVGDMVVSWCYEEPHSQEQGSCHPSRNNSAILPATATQFNITDLLPCSNYTISVAAATAGDVFSPYRNITLHTAYESAASIDHVDIQMNSSRVVIAWVAPPLPKTCMEGYQVCWRPQSTPATQECSIVPTEYYVFDRLPACDEYMASVRTAIPDGSLSNATNLSLDLATPSEVINLTVVNHASNFIEVGWLSSLVNSRCVRNYEVCYGGAAGTNQTCVWTSNEDTERNITGLQPGLTYAITVRALGATGKLSAATTIQATTDVAGGGNGGSRFRSASVSVFLTGCGLLMLDNFVHLRL